MSVTLPKEFLLRMQDMLKDTFPAFLKSYEKPVFQALRVNTLKVPASFLSGCCFSAQDTPLRPVPWCRTGFYYESRLHPGKHPYHEAGAYYIQEPSAMAPAVFLDAHPGETILDLCAAPGGKSSQIACMMQQQGILISNDIHPARAKILSENIERMGIANCIVTNESPASLAALFPAYFDRILVDAPCSGEGMFHKNEEACTQWSEENVRLCADRQDEILEQADKMLKQGGRIVYSTCTFAPLENEGTIGRFLSAHPDYHLPDAPLYEGISRGYIDDGTLTGCSHFRDADFSKYVAERVIRLMPHQADGEGHFTAILQKGEPDAISISQSSTQTCHGQAPLTKYGRNNKNAARPESLAALQDFFDGNINLKLPGTVTAFGKQLYLLPASAPSLKGVKVLRPGLHLGSMNKDRFEPSHALALFLKPENARHVCALSGKDPLQFATACHFIEGQTFPYEGEKGWYLITLDGIPLGWGRLAAGIMKNYYPKGLRKSL